MRGPANEEGQLIIEGTHTIEGIEREVVFDALADPAVLARSLPGCRRLVDQGDGHYEITIDAGVGSVRGEYTGEVTIGEAKRPELYEATLNASGGPGDVRATLQATLSENDSGTDVAYRMDAQVTGAIAGVGQRVITGVSRRNANDFLKALGKELSEPTPEPPPEPAAAATSDGGAPDAGPVAAAEPGTVYEGRPRSSGPPAGVIAGHRRGARPRGRAGRATPAQAGLTRFPPAP